MLVFKYVIDQLKKLKKLPKDFEYNAAIKMNTAVLVLVAELKRSIRDNLNKTSAAGYKKRKTGHLAQSLTHRVLSTRGNMYATVGTNVPYASLQDKGGVVKPKGQFLTIPLTKNQVLPSAGSLHRAKLTYIRGRVIYLKSGNVPAYALARQVRIPASHWVESGLMSATPRIQAMFSDIGSKI